MDAEPKPDWIAQLDQAIRTVADTTKLIRAYYQGLVDAGFTEEQALILTVAYQNATLQIGAAMRGGDG